MTLRICFLFIINLLISSVSGQNFSYSEPIKAGDVCDAVSQDGDGNFCFTGLLAYPNFKTNVVFNTDTLLTGKLSSDVVGYIVKTDSDYNVQWHKQVHSNQIGQPVICTDNENNILWSSRLQEFLKIDTLVYNRPNDKTSSLCVTKFDPDGELQWCNIVKSTMPDDYMFDANAIKTDNDNNVYIGGRSDGDLIFYRNSLALDSVYIELPTGTFIFLAKYDKHGELMWCKTLPQDMYQQVEIYDIEIDSNLNIYMTGYWSAETGTFDSIPKKQPGADIFIVKINQNRKIEWLHQIGRKINSFLETGYALAIDECLNSLYVTGSFSGSTDFGGITLSSEDRNIFLASYDLSGDINWVKKMGCWSGMSSSVEAGTELVVDNNGMLYIGGTTSNEAYFDEYSINTNNDFFIAKYSPFGSFLGATAGGYSQGSNHPIYCGLKDMTISSDHILTIVGGTKNGSLFGTHTFVVEEDKYSSGFVCKITDANNPVFNTSMNNISFEADSALNQYISIESNLEWDLENSAEWIGVNEHSGKGSCILEFKADTNYIMESRQATVKLISKYGNEIPINIYQKGSDNWIGINSLSHYELITIYPNPVLSTIHFNEDTIIERAFIISVNGKILINQSINNNILDVSSLKTGNYILRVESRNKVYINKFIKK